MRKFFLRTWPCARRHCLTLGDSPGLILFPVLCDGRIQGILRIWRRKERLNAEEDGPHLEGGTPLVFKDVETNAAWAEWRRGVRGQSPPGHTRPF